MKVDYIGTKGTWREVADSCNTTINRDAGTKEPTSRWKTRILLAEHSPIRQKGFKFKWTDLKYWVSVHFVRHFLGIVHYVRTQRTDRTGVDRDDLLQSALVEHEIDVNAQAMINISRKRLCSCASKETQQAWQLVLDSIKDKEPELYSVCVPECMYRGFCPEFECCGKVHTEEFKKKLIEYRKID